MPINVTRHSKIRSHCADGRHQQPEHRHPGLGAAVFAGDTLHWTSRQDTHLAAGHTLSMAAADSVGLHSADGGLRAIAQDGVVSVQAHQGEQAWTAQHAITISSSENAVEILAPCKITLNGAREEMAILLALAAQDPQGHHTRRAGGRGAGATIINTAIEQKIPFRDAISKVCEAADSMPILSLRRKKGVTIQDLPRAKRRAMEALLRLSLEELADINLDEFFLVRLRQLAASLLFEFMDECLEWNSPLKCEVNFGPPARYADHPVTGTTRLLRSNTKINPFYPSPYQRRRGNIAADLIITEYRHERPDKGNIFAIVEIKFQNDRIESEQFENYQDLLKSAATYKTAISPVRFNNNPVTSGGRLSLFRYPEDVAVHGANETRQEPQDTHQTSSRRKKKTP